MVVDRIPYVDVAAVIIDISNCTLVAQNMSCVLVWTGLIIVDHTLVAH